MKEDFTALHSEFQKLKFRSRIKDVLFIIAIIILAVLISNIRTSKMDKVIRVQGIIVEDENGKERILIGAPIPYAKNRIRNDTARIKETWGKRMGGNYMNWYQDYAHHANGIIILDEEGWDKIIVGDPAPDPIFGKRIGPSTGIIINDNKGLERTGYGILNVNGEDRVVLGLDNSNGTEGATLSVMPNGTVGLYINSEQQSIFLGNAKKGNGNSPNEKDFHGIIIQDKEKRQKRISANENN